MHQLVRYALIATFFMTGPAWPDACSLNADNQIRTLAADCLVASAFEASFRLSGLSPASIVLKRRNAEFKFGNPTNEYYYEVLLADDEAARQLTADDQAFVAARADFETALRKSVCQTGGASDYFRDGGRFDFSILIRLTSEPEAAVKPWGTREASVFIHTCEAP